MAVFNGGKKSRRELSNIGGSSSKYSTFFLLSPIPFHWLEHVVRLHCSEGTWVKKERGELWKE